MYPAMVQASAPAPGPASADTSISTPLLPSKSLSGLPSAPPSVHTLPPTPVTATVPVSAFVLDPISALHIGLMSISGQEDNDSGDSMLEDVDMLLSDNNVETPCKTRVAKKLAIVQSPDSNECPTCRACVMDPVHIFPKFGHFRLITPDRMCAVCASSWANHAYLRLASLVPLHVASAL